MPNPPEQNSLASPNHLPPERADAASPAIGCIGLSGVEVSAKQYNRLQALQKCQYYAQQYV